MIRVESLPQITGLEEIKLRAGQRGAHKIIRWPYIAENTDIENWIEGGELIFVTGLNYRWEVEDFRYLIRTAKNRNASGMVILTASPYLDAIPNEVLLMADEYDFPVFEQPYSLPMVRVTELLSNAIMMAHLEQKSTRWLMQNLLENDQPSRMTLIKAAELGIDINSLLSVAVIKPCLDQTSGFVRCQFLLNRFISEHGSELPLIEYHNGWLLSIPIVDDSENHIFKRWERLAELIKTQGITCDIGISEAHGLKQFSDAASQAHQSAEFCATHQGCQVVHYNNLGISQIFTKIDDRNLLKDFCKQHLGDLYDCSDKQKLVLKETLVCFFQNMGQLRQTAKALDIHRNTLNNRLQKIENYTHLSLDNAQQRLSIQTALVAERFVLSELTSVFSEQSDFK
tara:strand:- start:6277 stop:7470 length:1194 start_codon:yes stop_codon:yes gene_type:complete